MNKKWLSVITIILTVCLSFCLVLPVHFSYADELTPNDLISGGMGQGDPSADIDQGFVNKYGGTISNYMYSVAIIIAVVAISYVGLMYITGGITQKVDYKKNLIPIGVGIGIVVFLATILRIIANAAGSI